MLDDLLSQAAALQQQHKGIRACGVAIGGPLDSYKGIVRSPPNLPGWDEVPLKELLESKLELPTRVEHDATACALAESRWGAGRGKERLAYFTCGTGFGVGFVFDGEPYYGAEGYPSDIGHVRLFEDGPLGYGATGTIEAFCAASALGRLACWKFPARWSEPPDAEQIEFLAERGDADARSVIELNAAAVGRVCGLVCDLLHTDMIVIGSLGQYLGDDWVEQVRSGFHTVAHPIAADRCHITASQLGTELQDLAPIAAGMRLLEEN
jgi:glucokinase